MLTSYIIIIVYGCDTLGQWNPLSANFIPFFCNVFVLAGCLWIADTVASFVNAAANDPLAVCIVANQVAFAGCGFFNLSYFVGFHDFLLGCVNLLCSYYIIYIGICQVVSLTIYDIL